MISLCLFFMLVAKLYVKLKRRRLSETDVSYLLKEPGVKVAFNVNYRDFVSAEDIENTVANADEKLVVHKRAIKTDYIEREREREREREFYSQLHCRHTRRAISPYKLVPILSNHTLAR